MINLKACHRCGGDMMREEVLGEAELVCLQCGHRTSAPSSLESHPYLLRRSPASPQKRAA